MLTGLACLVFKLTVKFKRSLRRVYFKVVEQKCMLISQFRSVFWEPHDLRRNINSAYMNSATGLVIAVHNRVVSVVWGNADKLEETEMGQKGLSISQINPGL